MGNRAAAIQMYNAAVEAVNNKSNPVSAQTAYQCFASAILADPTYGLAHYQHACNNHDLKREHAALAGWRRALECENTPEDLCKIHSNISSVLTNLGKLKA